MESSDAHNRIVKDVVEKIVSGVNFEFSSSMVCLESIVLGVIAFYYKADERAVGASLDYLYDGVLQRLKDHKL